MRKPMKRGRKRLFTSPTKTPMTSLGKAEGAFVQLDLTRSLRGDSIGVGTMYNKHSKQWLVWLSTNGLDIIILCAQKDEAEANAVVEEIVAAARSGDLADEEKVPTLMSQWRSRGQEVQSELRTQREIFPESGECPSQNERSVGKRHAQRCFFGEKVGNALVHFLIVS